MSWECPRHPAGEHEHTRAGKRTTSCAKIASASTGAQTPQNRVGHLTPGTWLASRSAPEQDAASPSRCCGECDVIQVLLARHHLQLSLHLYLLTPSSSSFFQP
ncbi:unnamed protein product [Urochloa humidicola]